MTEQKIAIVGSGLIGRAWAIAFARGGWRVALYDPEDGAAAQAREAIGAAFADLDGAGLLDGGAPAELLARVAVGGSARRTG